jgi:predicted DsbA family dithiol-disulfide isomerase
MKLSYYYDFICPYCVGAYAFFPAVVAEFEGGDKVEIEWLPTESHPRPEEHHPHSDLAIEGFHAAVELGACPYKANDLLYAARRRDLEKPEVIAEILAPIADSAKVLAILNAHKYTQLVLDVNDRFDADGGWAVPAFRINGDALDAVGGVGVTEEQLREFIRAHVGATK